MCRFGHSETIYDTKRYTHTHNNNPTTNDALIHSHGERDKKKRYEYDNNNRNLELFHCRICRNGKTMRRHTQMMNAHRLQRSFLLTSPRPLATSATEKKKLEKQTTTVTNGEEKRTKTIRCSATLIMWPLSVVTAADDSVLLFVSEWTIELAGIHSIV